MTEIRFYHLTSSPLERALPALAGKASESGKKIIIACPDKKQVDTVTQFLWTHTANSFIPHGDTKNGADFAAQQPIWVTDTEGDNPNQAEILITTNNTVWSDISPYSLCCEMLNGHDSAAVDEARERWKIYKEQGHDLTYWQQDENGAWSKKA